MRLTNIHLTNFRRFADLTIKDIPASAKLVVLAGPNGSGKSSLFDAMLLRHRLDSGYGWSSDTKYYDRPQGPFADVSTSVLHLTQGSRSASGAPSVAGTKHPVAAMRTKRSFVAIDRLSAQVAA